MKRQGRKTRARAGLPGSSQIAGRAVEGVVRGEGEELRQGRRMASEAKNGLRGKKDKRDKAEEVEEGGSCLQCRGGAGSLGQHSETGNWNEMPRQLHAIVLQRGNDLIK